MDLSFEESVRPWFLQFLQKKVFMLRPYFKENFPGTFVSYFIDRQGSKQKISSIADKNLKYSYLIRSAIAKA